MNFHPRLSQWMCIFHYLHEIKISQLSCMKGIILCLLKDIYFYWTFWLACYVPWVISSERFSTFRAHHSYLVRVQILSLDQGPQLIFCQLLSKLKLRAFVSQPPQNLRADTAWFLNHFKQHWVQQRLTSLVFPFSEWILQLELCALCFWRQTAAMASVNALHPCCTAGTLCCPERVWDCSTNTHPYHYEDLIINLDWCCFTRTCLKLFLCYTSKKPSPRSSYFFLSAYLTFLCHEMRAEAQALFHTV